VLGECRSTNGPADGERSALQDENAQESESRWDGDVKGRAKWGVVAVMSLAMLSWVFIPPFPAPSELVGMSHSAVVSLVGPSTGALPDKFAVWEKSRGVATWSLRASYDTWPIAPGALTFDARRCLWIQWAGVSIFCQRATQGR
jgi:hypothetical protein